MNTAVTRSAIAATYERIRPHVRRTPVIDVDVADFGLESRPLVFKLELFQHTGVVQASRRAGESQSSRAQHLRSPCF